MAARQTIAAHALAAGFICLAWSNQVAAEPKRHHRVWQIQGTRLAGQLHFFDPTTVEIKTSSGNVFRFARDSLSPKDEHYVYIHANHDDIATAGRYEREEKKQLKRRALANGHAKYDAIVAQRRNALAARRQYALASQMSLGWPRRYVTPVQYLPGYSRRRDCGCDHRHDYRYGGYADRGDR